MVNAASASGRSLDDFTIPTSQRTTGPQLGQQDFLKIMIEQLKGGFKISFRSRCGVDCNQLARLFGGGGHKAAAGAFVEGELDEVKSRVLSAASDALMKEMAC